LSSAISLRGESYYSATWASVSPRGQIDETSKGTQLALDVGAAGAEDDAVAGAAARIGVV